MDQQFDPGDAEKVASEMDTEIRALPLQNTPNVQAIRRKYSQKLKRAKPEFILDLARALLAHYGQRWLARFAGAFGKVPSVACLRVQRNPGPPVAPAIQ